MIAISENWAVLLIVLGAVGYLMLLLGRTKRGGGCCGSASSCMPSLSSRHDDADEDVSRSDGKRTFMVDSDRLALRARDLRRERDARDAS